MGIEYNCLEIAKSNRFRLVFEPSLKFMPFEPFYMDFVKSCDGKMVHRYVDIGFKKGDNQISSGGIVGKTFHKDSPSYVVKGGVSSQVIFVVLNGEIRVQGPLRVIGPTAKSDDWWAMHVDL